MKLRCANGGRWTSKGCGPCAGCQRMSAEYERQFWQAVFFGELNERGYTEAEWIAAGKPIATWRHAA